MSKILRTIVTVLGSFLVLLLMLPTILSYNKVTQSLLDIINKQMTGHLEVNEISLSWLGQQKLLGISYFDSDDNYVIKIDQVSSQSSLISWIRNHPSQGQTVITNFKAEGKDQHLKSFLVSSEKIVIDITKYSSLGALKAKILTFYNDSEGVANIEYDTKLKITLHNFPLDLVSALTVPINPVLGSILNTEPTEDNEQTTIIGSTRQGEVLSRSTFNNIDINPLKITSQLSYNNQKVDASLDAHYPTNPSFLSLINSRLVPEILSVTAGAPFDAKLLVRLKGVSHLNVRFQDPNIRLEATCFRDKGFIYLSEPLTCHISDLSPWLLNFLDDYLPLEDYVSGFKQPIECTINPKGFALPISPFELDDFIIAKGMLDIGKIYLKPNKQINEWLGLPLAIPLSLLKPYLTLWFTPLVFSLEKGVFTFERTDCLAFNTLHTAFWGSFDIEQQILDMHAGFVGDTPNQMVLQFYLRERLETLTKETNLVKTLFILFHTDTSEEAPPPPMTTIPWSKRKA